MDRNSKAQKTKKLNKLFNMLSQLPPIDWPSHLFIVTENQMMFSYGDGIIISRSFSPYMNIQNLNINSRNIRGKILEIFSKVELMLNSMIINEIKPQNEENLVELLNRVNFTSSIHLLKDWGIINKKIANKLFETKKVRDQFAHVWVKGSMNYKNRTIKDKKKFEEFKNDLSFVWTELIRLNDVNIKEIDSVIKKLEQERPKNN